jgi:hypothetical protein
MALSNTIEHLYYSLVLVFSLKRKRWTRSNSCFLSFLNSWFSFLSRRKHTERLVLGIFFLSVLFLKKLFVLQVNHTKRELHNFLITTLYRLEGSFDSYLFAVAPVQLQFLTFSCSIIAEKSSWGTSSENLMK